MSKKKGKTMPEKPDHKAFGEVYGPDVSGDKNIPGLVYDFRDDDDYVAVYGNTGDDKLAVVYSSDYDTSLDKNAFMDHVRDELYDSILHSVKIPDPYIEELEYTVYANGTVGAAYRYNHVGTLDHTYDQGNLDGSDFAAEVRDIVKENTKYYGDTDPKRMIAYSEPLKLDKASIFDEISDLKTKADKAWSETVMRKDEEFGDYHKMLSEVRGRYNRAWLGLECDIEKIREKDRTVVKDSVRDMRVTEVDNIIDFEMQSGVVGQYDV